MHVGKLCYAPLAVCFLFVAVPDASAQDLDACDEFKRFVERGEYPTALEELSWCRQAIEDLHFERIGQILERTIEGYEPGDAAVEGAMGIASVQLTYTKGGEEVELSLTSGSGQAQAGLSSLGALAGLANAMGVRAEGQSRVRVAGMTGQLEEKDDGSASLVVTMDGGMILTVNAPDADTAEAFAEAVIPELDDYLG